MFIEETFGIKVADDDVLPENFDSIAGLTSYVARKRDFGPAVQSQ
jgi:acyl carrier protein